MPKKIVLLLALFYLACEKGEDITLATSLLESRLGVNASADPLEGNALFFQDVRYGNGERNTLDILLPDATVLQGVVLFFHGGGFVSGDKADAYSDLLKNTMQQLLDNNIGIVSANYSFINTSDNSGVLSWKGPDHQGPINNLKVDHQLASLGQPILAHACKWRVPLQ